MTADENAQFVEGKLRAVTVYQTSLVEQVLGSLERIKDYDGLARDFQIDHVAWRRKIRFVIDAVNEFPHRMSCPTRGIPGEPPLMAFAANFL